MVPAATTVLANPDPELVGQGVDLLMTRHFFRGLAIGLTLSLGVWVALGLIVMVAAQ